MSEFIDVLRVFSAGKAVESSRLTDAVKWAIEQLKNHDQVRKVDNGDGTVTIRGLPVVVPSTLILEGEQPIEVRSLKLGTKGLSWIQGNGRHVTCQHKSDQTPGELRIILATKPEPVTWTPPASLPDGEYDWNGAELWSRNEKAVMTLASAKSWLGADFISPPRSGCYRKVGRIATWIGE